MKRPDTFLVYNGKIKERLKDNFKIEIPNPGNKELTERYMQYWKIVVKGIREAFEGIEEPKNEDEKFVFHHRAIFLDIIYAPF